MKNKMGKAIYCDRCGKLFNSSEVEMYKIKVSGAFNEDLTADFCEGCKSEIEGFLQGDDKK